MCKLKVQKRHCKKNGEKTKNSFEKLKKKKEEEEFLKKNYKLQMCNKEIQMNYVPKIECLGVSVTNANQFQRFITLRDSKSVVLGESNGKETIIAEYQNSKLISVDCYSIKGWKYKGYQCKNCKKLYRLLQGRVKKLKNRKKTQLFDTESSQKRIIFNLSKENENLKKENKELKTEMDELKKFLGDIDSLKKAHPMFSKTLDLLIGAFQYGKIPTKHFFFDIIQAGLNNISSGRNSFSEDLYKFAFHLKYLGGESIIDALRGEAEGKFNVPIPSNSAIKSKIPNFKFEKNSISSINLAQDNYFFAWDEMDVRHGLICVNGEIFGIEGNSSETLKLFLDPLTTVEDELTKKMIVFYAVGLNRGDSIPLFHCGISSNESRDKEACFQYLERLITKHEGSNQNKVSFIGGISDNSTSNTSLISKLSTKIPDYLHIFDPGHLCKSLRNNLSYSNGVSHQNSSFSWSTLRDLIVTNEVLSRNFEKSIKIADVMEWEPVQLLFKLVEFVNDEKNNMKDSFRGKESLLTYLDSMKKLYRVFSVNQEEKDKKEPTLSKEQKLKDIDDLITYFSGISLSDTTQNAVLVSLKSLKFLLEKYSPKRTSHLTSNVIEIFFSLIRRKNNRPNSLQFDQLFNNATTEMMVRYDENKPFFDSMKTETKKYNNNSLSFQLHFETQDKTKKEKKQLTKEEKDVLTSWKPTNEKKIRELSRGTAKGVFFPCIYPGCSHKDYSSIGPFTTHMTKEHHLKREIASSTVSKIVNDVTDDIRFKGVNIPKEDNSYFKEVMHDLKLDDPASYDDNHIPDCILSFVNLSIVDTNDPLTQTKTNPLQDQTSVTKKNEIFFKDYKILQTHLDQSKENLTNFEVGVKRPRDSSNLQELQEVNPKRRMLENGESDNSTLPKNQILFLDTEFIQRKMEKARIWNVGIVAENCSNFAGFAKIKFSDLNKNFTSKIGMEWKTIIAQEGFKWESEDVLLEKLSNYFATFSNYQSVYLCAWNGDSSDFRILKDKISFPSNFKTFDLCLLTGKLSVENAMKVFGCQSCHIHEALSDSVDEAEVTLKILDSIRSSCEGSTFASSRDLLVKFLELSQQSSGYSKLTRSDLFFSVGCDLKKFDETLKNLLKLNNLIKEKKKKNFEIFCTKKDQINYKKEIIDLTKDDDKPIDLTTENLLEFQKELISAKNGIKITRGTFNRMKDGLWLNDELINYFLSKTSEANPDCYFFSSFFYFMLMKRNTFDYKRVKKWTSKTDIFSFRMIFIPIHLVNHWILSFYDVKAKKLEIFDSLGGNHIDIKRNISKYLVAEHKARHNSSISIETLPEINNSSCQTNGHDCGVFIIRAAEQKASSSIISISQQEMPNLRRSYCSIMQKHFKKQKKVKVVKKK